MYIYKTTNIINGKVYVGKSEKDYNDNYYGSGILLKKAIKKYGINNFTIEVLEICHNIDDLNNREKFWILEYSNHSYNIAEGGTGGDTLKNHPNRDSIIKRRNLSVSESLKGHLVSEETRKKIGDSHKGKTLTDEHKEKLSEKAKTFYKHNTHHSTGKQLTDDHKEKLSKIAKDNGFGGDTWNMLTDEEKKLKSEKLSNSKKGKKLSDETKKKISDKLKGHSVSKETRDKISKTIKNK